MARKGTRNWAAANRNNTSDKRFMPGATDVNCLLIVVRFEHLGASTPHERFADHNR